LGASTNTRFREKLLKGILDGTFRDFHPRCDLFIRQTLNQKANYVEFPDGQRGCPLFSEVERSEEASDSSIVSAMIAASRLSRSFLICREPNVGGEQFTVAPVTLALHGSSELRCFFQPQRVMEFG